MANKLKVEELRTELAKRGLSTTGIKPTLVRKLEAAIRQESKLPLQDGNGDSIGNKRERDSEEEGNSNEPEKIMAIEEFRGMSVKQLREQAALRGISSTGSKKELLTRLCDDSEKDSSGVPQAEKEGDNSKKEKIMTATKKGAAVLDQWLPDNIKTQYHVLQVGDDIYDAMLNQTNVGDNNNKFYVIQALESDDGGRFMVYFRWGRVGVKGQEKLQGPYTSQESAIQEFEQKFHAKTKNHWSDRKDFFSYPKSYTWLEMDYSENEKESSVKEQSVSAIQAHPRNTKLEARVAKFISLICNVSMMRQQMMEIGYNADKLPLGKLSKSTILKGYEVLKRIAEVIGQSNRRLLEQLSGEIEVATKLLKDDIGCQEDPLYSQYQSLRCELTPLDCDCDEFNMIAKYMQNTHAKTHSNYTVDIVHLFRVSRDDEVDRFSKFASTKNRMLLWHGSRLTNWTGILSQGLRIAPPEAPVTGYMFGKGVYFADMFSKSANYCYASHSTSSGVLLLCEVALGDMAELRTAKYDADKLPEGKLSTKGVGRTAPDLSKARRLDNGVLVPEGKPKDNPHHEM
ncbi:hypothetical protein G4B88_000284 [Cannabis sativa]|uniref:Poly [ADP-ribose] polymerase n=1 Tax=Cannabis sativa TaxID=3483 RepID=A0A7J6GQ49_CANSA|nr:hypothetical protein G4B88_000284 [Cannabis sativa]